MSNERVVTVLPPPASNQAWRGLREVFQVKYTDTLAEVRGEGTGIDLNPRFTLARAYPTDSQRDAIAGNMYAQGRRSSMAPIPTSQALIQRITGVPDPISRGR